MSLQIRYGLGLSILLLLFACGADQQETVGNPDALFQKVSASQSGVAFANTLTFDNDFNIYTYRNYYNGGGVALGDINQDGLTDIYFTGNMVPNRLYLNQGNLQFTDITEEAGVAGTRSWSTGVTMADVDGDGWLDIYVCNSGDIAGDQPQNELFINQKDGTFSEQAEAYGIADPGLSTHGVFFDYDKDGDLDLYLLNNSFQAIGSFNLRRNERPKRDPIGGDKLYRNEQGRFVDVSEAAGIYGSIIGFGLGVTVGDVNNDTWPDIYVSNDFFERDYLYINQQDGTFTEQLTEQIKSLSVASMGADFADINNDGYGDFFVTEMLPETNERIKTSTTFEDWNKYQENQRSDYYHQFTRNMLQLNNGDGTFSEIGRLAGVEATDWSWGALLFDMDNDGYKDIFVANGIYQDLTNQDFLRYIADDETKKSLITSEGVNYEKLVAVIPSNPVPNYAFRNQGAEGAYQFENVSAAWGLDEKGFSNGSAYGDLDNDGDLDLVVNNVNAPASIYANQSRQRYPDRHFLQLSLRGAGANPWAIGSRVWIKQGDKKQFLENMPMRGFQSSVDYRLHFGLGDIARVDTLFIEWYDGKTSVIPDPPLDQLLILSHQETPTARLPVPEPQIASAQLIPVSPARMGIDYVHQENTFSDFDRDRLLYHMISAEGPKMCSGDFNGDGYTDFYIGASQGQSGALYLYRAGGYTRVEAAVFTEDKASEDAGCACFDADQDGDMDLYVASGSNEFGSSSAALLDRLYFNDGRGQNWRKSEQPLPGNKFVSSSCVRPADVDGDGDLDLFVGGRLRPFLYGVPTDSYLLENDGKGRFRNVTSSQAAGLRQIGMLTDAVWADIDQDQDPDLIVVGEWMPIRVFKNEDGKLQETEAANLQETAGWWNAIRAADLDGDGDMDFVLGNHGTNSRFRASKDKPVEMYVNDFDQNGTAEQIITTYQGEESYPLALLHDLTGQMPGLRKRYLKYDSYKDQRIQDIFDTTALNRSVVWRVNELRSALLINEGGSFRLQPLPLEAQFAPIYAMLIQDLNQDQLPDILLGGNFYYAKPEVGRYDASYGLSLINQGNLEFSVEKAGATGFFLDGECRDMLSLKTPNESLIVVSRNNDTPLIFRNQ